MKPKAVIFDIDGVLANYLHRAEYILCRPKKWNQFFEAMDEDRVIGEMAQKLRAAHQMGHTVILLTGRAERYRALTEAWFAKNNLPYDLLIMRPNRVRRKGHLLKQAYYRRFIKSRYTVVVAYDDHPRIVQMWQDNGVQAYDCGYLLNFDDPNNENPQG